MKRFTQLACLSSLAISALGCSSTADDAGISDEPGGGGRAMTGGGSSTGGSSAAGSSFGGTAPSAGQGGMAFVTAGAGSGGSTSAAGTASSGGTAGAGTGGTTSGNGGAVGTPGVWENVTPAEFNLSQSYGSQDVVADAKSPGTFFAFQCLQGVWRSDDWGLTWTHVSSDGHVESGKPWGAAIAPDGSYMLAAVSDANEGAWKSTDDGVTWASHHIGGNDDPYMFHIDPSDKNHVLSSTHSIDNIFESKDGGETWTDRGHSGAGASNYVFFITSTTWLVEADNSAGTRRSTNSGGSWTKVGDMEHAHGNAQIFVDPDNGYIYVGSHAGGVHRSTDGGASFSQVSGTRASSVWATTTRIYAMDPGANGGGTDPLPQSATRADGTDWVSLDYPPAMNNGAKSAAVAFDESTNHWVIVSGNWNAGLWRMIEE